MDPFKVFDTPSAIEVWLLGRTTPASRNATTGILSPEAYGAAVRIKGSLDRTPGLGQVNKSNVARDQQEPQGGIDLSGELRLFTSGEKMDGSGLVSITIGDRIKVVYTAGHPLTLHYRVRALIGDYAWIESQAGGLATGRREWAIVLEDPPARPV